METLNFNDFISNYNLPLSGATNLTLSLIVFNMVFSAIAGIMIAWVYKTYFMGVLFQKTFAVTIIGVTMVTTLVMMVISGNLILSLGMVGALSIVRFRAAIKDPLDVLYIFWAVGTGISIAVSQFLVVFISIIIISLVFSFLSKLSSTKQPKLIVVTCDSMYQKEIENLFITNNRKILSRSTQMSDGKSEQVFETTDTIDSVEYLEKMNIIDPNAELRVLNYYGNN